MGDQEPYPECTKLLVVADDSQKIGEFLDWLEEQGIMLAESVQFEELIHPRLEVHRENNERLLARFFGIDLTAVERERRAMLASFVALASNVE